MLDLSNDWIFFDNTQTLTYYSRLSDGTFSSPTTCIGLKREDKKSYEESDGFEYSEHICVWEAWASTFIRATVAKRGDKFSATTITGNTTWIVEKVDYCDFTSRFRLHCLQEGMGS